MPNTISFRQAEPVPIVVANTSCLFNIGGQPLLITELAVPIPGTNLVTAVAISLTAEQAQALAGAGVVTCQVQSTAPVTMPGVDVTLLGVLSLNGQSFEVFGLQTVTEPPTFSIVLVAVKTIPVISGVQAAPVA